MGGRGGPRVFLACRVPAPLAEELSGRVRAALPADGFRFPRADGLHLTLYFHGETPEPLVAELVRAARAEVARTPALELRVAGAGAFPDRRRPRVLWLGAAGEGLLELRRAALAASRAVGFDVSAEEERPFRPHVTVARPRRPARPEELEAFFALDAAGSFRCEALELLESVPAAGGPHRYVTRAALPLGGGPV